MDRGKGIQVFIPLFPTVHDGVVLQVAAVVKAERLYLKQNTAVSSLRGGPNAGNGAARIAMHYKFSLDHVFERDPEVGMWVWMDEYNNRRIKVLWIWEILVK